MRLNTYIIAESLSFPVKNYSKKNIYRRTLEYCVIWKPEIRPGPSCLYILSADDLKLIGAFQEEISLLCIGDLAKPIGINAELLCVPSYVSKEMALAHVLELFYKYDEYEEYLNHFCMKGDSYKSLGKKLADFFSMPVLALGEFSEILFFGQTEKSLKALPVYQKAVDDFLPETMEKAICGGKPDKDGFYTGETDEKIPFFAYFIKKKNLNTWIVLLDIYKRLSLKERILLHHFGDFMIQYREFFFLNRYQNLNICLEKISLYLKEYEDNTENRKKEEIEEIKKRIRWADLDRLVCIAIQSNTSWLSVDYIAPSIQLLVKHTLILNASGTLYLCNLSQAELTMRALENHLLGEVKNELMAIGVSSEFTEFSEFPVFVRQAESALEIGGRLDYHKRVYQYQDYVCDYLIRHGAYSLPLASVLPEGIKEILNYDKKHHTDYYPTLVAYCRNDMKLKNTAEDLKIHLSTLKYRLKKIGEMLKMDLYKPENRLHLSIVFFLLKNQ